MKIGSVEYYNMLQYNLQLDRYKDYLQKLQHEKLKTEAYKAHKQIITAEKVDVYV